MKVIKLFNKHKFTIKNLSKIQNSKNLKIFQLTIMNPKNDQIQLKISEISKKKNKKKSVQLFKKHNKLFKIFVKIVDQL